MPAARAIWSSVCAAAITMTLLSTVPRAEARGQQTAPVASKLTNSDVVSMLKIGLSANVIVAKIKTSDCSFDTSPDALAKLQAAGASDAVLLAMLQGSGTTRPDPASSTQAASAGGGGPIADDGKTRIFVTDSQSWSSYGYSWMHGDVSSVDGGSVSKGGARPQTVEIIKTLGEKCPELVVTNQPQRANYVITLDHEGGKGLLRVRNKVAVFGRNGDALFSDSTLTLGDSVQRACGAIKRDSKR